MKLRNQNRLSITIFAILLTIIIVSVFATQQQTSRLNDQEAVVKDIQTRASNLQYLSNDYFLFQVDSGLTQWQTEFNALTIDLSKLSASNPEQRTMVNNVKNDSQLLYNRWNDVVSYLQNADRNVSIRVLPVFQGIWSRMSLQNQGLIFDTQQLSQNFQSQIDQLNSTSLILIFVLLGVFGAYFITNYLITFRNTLKSISELQSGIAVIGSGNLDYTLKAEKKDEIGEISRSLNQMTANLKTVTASKIDLEREIVERKKAEAEREIMVQFLRIANKSNGTHDLIKQTVDFFQNQSGCEAVGIRLKDGEDYPYYETSGFPQEHVQLENHLCSKDKNDCLIRDFKGNPVLECMCGNILCGRFDPSKPFFTEKGSFWANDTTRLLATTTEADRQATTRNRCNGEGYESVALIALRVGNNTLGLLQLNDKRKNMFTLETIQIWERIADHLALALSKNLSEEALQKSEERWSTTLSSIGDSVIATDMSGAVTFMNAVAEELTGWTLSESLGKPLKEVFHIINEETRMEVESPVAKVLEKGMIVGLANHTILVRKDSSEVPLDDSGAPIKDENGNVRGVVLVFHDISERKEMERKLEGYSANLENLVEERTKQLRDSERLANIGATAGMVGHDIRNPLQAIISDIYLAKIELNSTPESDAKKNMLESLMEIEKNIDYINKIVADLQDYARNLKPTAKEVNLQTLMDELIAKNKIPKNIKVQVKVQENAGTIISDPDILKRILGNLVSNSVQAMPEGGKLSIQAYKKANDAVITVADTGVGIPEGVKDKLFTPLFTTKSKGQGFGLAVVKRMTEALGGTVALESQTGKGTTFTITIPSGTQKNGSKIF
jgi:PAS domain S-box-containing protein